MTERENPNSTVSAQKTEDFKEGGLTVRRTVKDFIRWQTSVYSTGQHGAGEARWEFHGVMEEKIDRGKGLRVNELFFHLH